VRGNREHAFDVIEVFEQVAPSYEDEVCDLITNPETAEHFVPEAL
jgi:branched-chain amino acid transport system substrate-binding protein